MRTCGNLVVALAAVIPTTLLGGDLAESGPMIGAPPEAFQVWDVTGPNAGRSLCYRCDYGAEPVVCVFTRNINASVTKLAEQIDADIAKNSVLKSYLVWLAPNTDGNEAVLKNAARTHAIKNVPLTILGNTEGPKGYRIDPDAEVTVVFWKGGEVRKVHAFAQGDLSDETIKKIIEDLPKILR